MDRAPVCEGGHMKYDQVLTFRLGENYIKVYVNKQKNLDDTKNQIRHEIGSIANVVLEEFKNRVIVKLLILNICLNLVTILFSHKEKVKK